MTVNKKLIKDHGDYYFIDSNNPKGRKANCCPFCDTETFSGSWAPEICKNEKCNAICYFGAWTQPKQKKVKKK